MRTTVTLLNEGGEIAFLVKVRLLRAGATGGVLDPQDVRPTFFSDNMLVLLPYEKREITADYDRESAGNTEPLIEVEAFNSDESVTVLASRR